ncbi:MAG: hypothetical protein A2Z18_02220 [Armatimonadetes bacterium RBG_16_58_9]|nr:MAG: hypothetical protein A2Z18_02220 [Armatimonadetes bacterium RBG_16_58_9]
MSAQVLRAEGEDVRPEWAEPISSQLDFVERTLESAIVSDVSAAFDVAMQLVCAGGKRIRPALVLLSALASARDFDDHGAAGVSAAVELIHMASLIHDDVVDETDQRRGAPTAHTRWGSKVSVLGGDYLLSKAFTLIAVADQGIIRVLSDVAVKMTESELLQATSEGNITLWEKNYHRIIRDKTAWFMGGCCECGAIVANAGREMTDALRDYGVQLGLAFQITDDVLDITGDPALTGKEVGTDILHGKFTLPVLIAARTLEADRKKALWELLNKPALTDSEASEVAAIAAGCGAVEQARQIALDYASKAGQCLKLLPPSDYTSALEALTTFVTGRKS